MTSPIRSVTAAAAASVMSDSKAGYTSRSIVPSDENPASSARRAQSTMPRRSTPTQRVWQSDPDIHELAPRQVVGWLDGHRLDFRGASRRGPARCSTRRAWRTSACSTTDGRPRVLPVTFAVFDGAVWSAIDHKPKRRAGEDLARVRWLRDRPESALTVDRYDDDWTRLAWVQLLGTTTVDEVAGHDDVLAALAARYPQYRDRAPDGPLLRLAPERAVFWSASD